MDVKFLTTKYTKHTKGDGRRGKTFLHEFHEFTRISGKGQFSATKERREHRKKCFRENRGFDRGNSVLLFVLFAFFAAKYFRVFWFGHALRVGTTRGPGDAV
jgi:hypothetical protein